MIPGTIMPILHERLKQYPVISVAGTRQSGKITLCGVAFPGHTYITQSAPHLSGMPKHHLGVHQVWGLLVKVPLRGIRGRAFRKRLFFHDTSQT